MNDVLCIRSIILIIIIINIIIVECSEGEVRLVDGQNEYEGRVEVCRDGEWKTICDRLWSEEEAKVVCRHLNYSNPSSTLIIIIMAQ